jgi:hypothetical protein
MFFDMGSGTIFSDIFKKKNSNILLVRDGIWTQQYETLCLLILYVTYSFIRRKATFCAMRMRLLSLWQEHGYRQEIASSSCSSINACLLQHTTTGITWNYWTD